MRTQGEIRVGGFDSTKGYSDKVKAGAANLINLIYSAAPKPSLTQEEIKVWQHNRDTAIQSIHIASMLSVKNEYL